MAEGCRPHDWAECWAGGRKHLASALQSPSAAPAPSCGLSSLSATEIKVPSPAGALSFIHRGQPGPGLGPLALPWRQLGPSTDWALLPPLGWRRLPSQPQPLALAPASGHGK